MEKVFFSFNLSDPNSKSLAATTNPTNHNTRIKRSGQTVMLSDQLVPQPAGYPVNPTMLELASCLKEVWPVLSLRLVISFSFVHLSEMDSHSARQ